MAKINTFTDIRTMLLEEIVKIREGKAPASSVNAITNATGKIFSSVKLEMEYAKMTGNKPDIILFSGPKVINAKPELQKITSKRKSAQA